MSDRYSPDRPIPNHDLWPAFSLPWDDTSSGPTDMSHLLHRPAGSRGFIGIREGHLATADGQRWRAWGQNLSMAGCIPSAADAPILARRLARFGINCIRLHFFDLRFPGGITIRSADKPGGDAGTRKLDPEALERLDFFIACLKENGVYVDLNLNVARPFTAVDGVKQAEWIGYGKALTYFDPVLIELQKEYARQLLTHVNPHTGLRYADEPAIALIELVNENSLLESWAAGRLSGKQTSPGSTWCDIPPAYAEDLDRLWNEHLRRLHSSAAGVKAAFAGDLQPDEDPAKGTVKRLHKDQFAKASRERFIAEAEFYAGFERRFFAEMAQLIRHEIGARQLILGTSDHNHYLHQDLHVRNNTLLDVMDGHCYWQHPRMPSGWSKKDWTITNTAMVDAPDHSAVAQLARSRVAGKPYVCSEINEPFPNDYACEFIPLLSSYALFHDWDGLFWYTLSHGETETKAGHITGFFSMTNDPVKLAQTAAGALAFHRGDLDVARKTVLREMTHEHAVTALRTTANDDRYPFSQKDIPGRLALTHATAVANFDASANTPAGDSLCLPLTGPIVSDTHQLTWDPAPGQQRVLIDSARYQAITGWAGSAATTNLVTQITTPFSSVSLISLDGRPISESCRLLLLTTARVANTGMRWKDGSRQTLTDQFGTAPTRIEPVLGTLELQGLSSAHSLTLTTLDGSGQPMPNPIVLPAAGNAWRIDLGRLPPSAWHLLEVKR